MYITKTQLLILLMSFFSIASIGTPEIAGFDVFSQNPLFIQQRENWKPDALTMVKTQIKARGLENEKVLVAMTQTPRHLFVPHQFRLHAWADRPLPIGEGQTISQPYIVALMTDLLELKGNEKVLEIGTGSGYQAAVLSHLADEVYSMEIVRLHADSSRNRLKRLGYENVFVKWGDGYRGWPMAAPFDRIIVTAAPPEIPAALVSQLKPGGLMVLPVGENYQQLKIVRKNVKGEVSIQDDIPVRFVPMVHEVKD